MSGRHVARAERRRGLIILAILLGTLLSGVTVLTASRAAFSDTTSNDGNYVTVGDVTLTDNDSDVGVLFEITDMAPGDSETSCIEVTYEGSISDPGQVVIYSGGFTDSGSLATEVNLTIEEGTGAGTFDDCTGFTLDASIFSGTLTAFDTAHTGYSSGAGTWDPSSTPESLSYRITVELDPNADTASQGQSITNLIFTWEVQS